MLKKGSVYIFYKTTLSSKVLSSYFLQECVNFEVFIKNKICQFIHLCRSPSQSQDEFYDFLTNLDLDHSFNINHFSPLIDDFNAKSNKWLEGDRSSIDGSSIDFLISQFELSPINKEPTHVLENSSSCIYLIFTNQPDTLVESRVHHLLYQNCHHQIYFPNWILKYITRLLMKRQFFTTPKQMLTIFNKQLIFLVGRSHYLIQMLMLKCQFFPILS